MTWPGLKNIITTEPVLVTGAAQAVLALLSATVLALTAAESGAILAATTAGLALAAAVLAKRAAVPALTGFVSAVVTLLVAFGVPHVEPSIVSTLNAAIVAVAALIARGHVTPVVTLQKMAAAAGPVQLTASVGSFPDIDTVDLARKIAAAMAVQARLAPPTVPSAFTRPASDGPPGPPRM